MSAPNPTVRECWKCGDACAHSWPAPDLCQKHLDQEVCHTCGAKLEPSPFTGMYRCPNEKEAPHHAAIR